ncbi:ABC transporter permease [Bacillus cereus group sp. Bc005]|uniref:ABC transporter permease n=1 Tax=Bacillus cereus group TaxID=86661 RepID=UPI00097554B5|nr:MULTISPECIES: ABC transporter permease [Bacillus cereus group]ONG63317.1 ABC transporter permease [Bacillus cereus]MCC2535937.1 ABC transporter permease [Bacillus paranthracis]MDA1619879.1 ABC transporter permease [Bacillus cereus group sp. TH204-1LC]MDA2194910.1 ABC transporter permease [Bacillus cereus group sp. Bc238]MDA2200480.1 ABC transporter permease [Bacillus cereus group sp. Bc237]
MRIKSAFIALKKRFLFSVLLLIQITFGLATITSSINVFYNLNYLNDKSSSVLNGDKTYLVTFEMTTDRLQSNQFNKEKIQAVYNTIHQNKDVISYGTYEERVIEIESSNRPFQNSMITDLKHKTFHDERPTIKTIFVDENYYKMLHLPLKPEEGFSYDDFQKNSEEKTKVLMGSYFKKYFQVGDTINNQYTITGFLPENKFIVNNNTTNTYLKLDYAMIMPMSFDRFEKYEAMFLRLHQSTVLYLQKGADVKKLEESIQLKGNGGTFHLKSLGDEINEDVTLNGYSEIPQLIVGILFIVFSIVGIVVTTIVSILMRKREFGIKIAFGESKFGMFIQIVLENIIVAITGLGMSIAYFSWRYGVLLQMSKDLKEATVLDFKLDMPILFFVFLFLLLIIIVSNVTVFLFIRKLEPKTLIGGME